MRSITIQKNDVSKCELFRCYIVYRFPNVTKIDGKRVSDIERYNAKQIF